jgi:chromosome segregation ATPase
MGAGLGGVGGQSGDADKKLSAEKKKTEKLEEEVKALQLKLKSFEDSGQRLAQRQQQLAVLRKQLKGREDELSAMKEQLEAVGAEKEGLRRKAAAAEGRVQQLEVAVQQARAVSTGRGGVGVGAAGGGGREQGQLQALKERERDLEQEVSELRRRAGEHAIEVQQLKEQLISSNSRAAQGLTERQGAAQGGGSSTAATVELRRLREENEKLRQELSAFDMDFFNEIEDLKYKYSEAVKKLRVYEGTGGAASTYGEKRGGAGAGSRAQAW